MATAHRNLQRVDSAFLAIAAIGGLISDFAGAFGGVGPLAAVLAGAPYLAIGLVEAHALALIFAAVILRLRPTRAAHLVAASVHVVLGAANVIFWPIFAVTGIDTIGYLVTALHWLFVVLQLVAAASVREAGSERVATPSGILQSRPVER